MKYIGRILGWILLGINICMAVLLLICAYSSYINPDFFLLLWCHPYLYTYQSVRERTSRGCRQSIVIQYDGF